MQIRQFGQAIAYPHLPVAVKLPCVHYCPILGPKPSKRTLLQILYKATHGHALSRIRTLVNERWVTSAEVPHLLVAVMPPLRPILPHNSPGIGQGHCAQMCMIL